MFPEINLIQLMPLRAIVFQLLFLLVAIEIETVVLYRYLALEYKTCTQYAATVNLLTTFIGWLVFFGIAPLLPGELKTQLISFIFFEQFFDTYWVDSIPPIAIFISFGMFLATFWLKVKGLDWLDVVLEKRAFKTQKDLSEEGVSSRLLRKKSSLEPDNQPDNRVYAVFVANACSFSAILFLLFVRFFEKTIN